MAAWIEKDGTLRVTVPPSIAKNKNRGMMSTRGWENYTQTDVTRRELKQATAAKPSKYRNVKVVVDGERFDSKREAQYWQELKLREKAGEIEGLGRQIEFPLRTSCDVAGVYYGMWFEVAQYVADFVYYDCGTLKRHVVDAKGKRTAMYQLKKKWLELQSGIVIEEA